MCPWEDKLKVRFKRHLEACEKKYVPEKNLALGAEWDPPGVNLQPVAQPPLTIRGAAASPASSKNASASSLSSVAANQNAVRNVNSYQFHPLVPKDHVKAANTILAAATRPVKPTRNSYTPPVNPCELLNFFKPCIVPQIHSFWFLSASFAKDAIIASPNDRHAKFCEFCQRRKFGS